VGKGRKYLGSANRFVDAVLGGWQLAATYEWQPGPLLDFGNIFYYGNDVNDIKNVQRTWDRWFNTDNFERVAANGPAAYHVRVFPTRIPGLRADSTNQWNANIAKNFRLTEAANLQLRLDALNVQNRSQMAAPVTDPVQHQLRGGSLHRRRRPTAGSRCRRASSSDLAQASGGGRPTPEAGPPCPPRRRPQPGASRAVPRGSALALRYAEPSRRRAPSCTRRVPVAGPGAGRRDDGIGSLRLGA
jgi:hypothetical protein